MIVFARHGRTAINREGRLQGRIDAPLDDTGLAQARALGDVLAAETVRRVVASPLLRARATAEAIADRHGLAVEVEERLIEIDYGEWDGLSLRDVPAADWAAWRADTAFVPPGGESLVAVTARVASFCSDVLPGAEGVVVAVSHVSPIKAAVCWALGIDEAASWRMQLGVAALTRIGARPDGGPFLQSFNETPRVPAASGDV